MSKPRIHCQPDACADPGNCDICHYYETLWSAKFTFPHCDAYVIHAPKECTYCDTYGAGIQQWREAHGVNFTGENDPDKRPCPASLRRKVDDIHRWAGNRPAGPSCKVCGTPAAYINLALGCPKGHGPV